MSQLTQGLLGRRRVQEFTGAGAVPTTDGAGPMLNIKSTKAPVSARIAARAKEKDKERKLKEDDDSIIPDDAEPVAASTVSPAAAIGGAETGRKNSGERIEGQPGPDSNLLPTSLAVVAPDCTPGWNKLLSPATLPDARPATNPPAEPNQPDSKGPGPTSATDALRLVRPSASGTTGQGLESQAESLARSVVQEHASSTPIPMNEADLLGRGKPMPDPVQSSSTSGVLKRFQFNR